MIETMVKGNWMRYTDIMYNGNKYRGVKFTQHRPYYPYGSSSNDSDQYDNGYNTNTVYWFKFEPIDWRVLDPSTGFVMCETIIDSQPYSNTMYYNVAVSDSKYAYFNDSSYKNYASDYETSSIRQWLNNDFYNIAFTDSEKKEINTTTLNNDGYYTSKGTTGYENLDSNSTKDKIFLLSYNELRTNYFGFASSESTNDAARFAKGSDYAQSQGLHVTKSSGSTYNGNSRWLLRSPGNDSESCCYVEVNGMFRSYPYIDCTSNGVRPALISENFKSGHKHRYTSKVTTPATHLVEGVKTFTCSCGYTYTESISRIEEHTYTTEVIAPTCTQRGYTTYICECGYCYIAEYLDALGHMWMDAIIYKEATCTTDAIHYYECLNCVASYMQEAFGTALEHRDYDNDNECDYGCGLKNIYNLGEETYGFENFSDKDAKGHCFGMSVTSSAYHLGLLDSTDVGAKSNREINTLSYNEKVIKPICYYQQIQGSISNAAMVAGGTNYKDEDKRDIEADWNEVISYVRNHKYDDSGTLQIGFRGEYTSKNGSIKKGGHAINFLRYKVVDGQERIYAYDNNYPDDEVYFYKDKDGKIKQAPHKTFDVSIYSITLRKVSTYIKLTKELKTLKYFLYATGGFLGVLVGNTFLMDLNIDDEEYYMYEFPEGTTTVKITPLVDNATFIYMGQEYSFGKIDEDTYAELTLSTSEDDTPEFIIINAPEDEPEPHEHNYKSVITKPTCTTQGYTTYSCDCGESYIADIKDKLSHIESAPIKENFVNSTCTSSGSYTEVVCCSVCKFEISRNNIEIPATGHNYNNGVCTSCGDDLTANCSCNCHAGGIKGLIFKLILFFQKLFRMNRICEGCYVRHY